MYPQVLIQNNSLSSDTVTVSKQNKAPPPQSSYRGGGCIIGTYLYPVKTLQTQIKSSKSGAQLDVREVQLKTERWFNCFLILRQSSNLTRSVGQTLFFDVIFCFVTKSFIWSEKFIESIILRGKKIHFEALKSPPPPKVISESVSLSIVQWSTTETWLYRFVLQKISGSSRKTKTQ